MIRSPAEIESHALAAMRAHGHEHAAAFAGKACAFLESVDYPGLKLLAEALKDPRSSLVLERDAIGFDLQNVSCVFIGVDLEQAVVRDGRAFLRNVRHGLYLLPGSVTGNYGIGCPIDPGFALGGERTKNPYAEKLALAAQNGVLVDDAVWQQVGSMAA